MPTFFRFLFATIILSLAFQPSTARAELVWTPSTGWKVEGGVLAGLSGKEATNALGLMNAARRAEEKGNLHSALSSYKKVTKEYPSSIYAAEAYYRTGIVREKRRQYYKAFDAFQQLIILYPSSDKFPLALGAQYRIATELAQGHRPYILGLIPGFRNKDKAVEYFERIVASAPYSDYAPQSLMSVAQRHQRNGDTEEAIDALDRVITTYPKNVVTPEAYLKIAGIHSSLVDGPYYDQASTKEAITYYEDYLIQFPGDAGAAEAEKGLSKMKTVLANSKMILADYYYKYRHNYKAAKVLYNEAITTYPDSPVATRAHNMLAKVEARLVGKPEPADVKAPADTSTPSSSGEKRKPRWRIF